MSNPGDDWPRKVTKEDRKGLKVLFAVMLGPFVLMVLWTGYQDGELLSYFTTTIIVLIILALGILGLVWLTWLLEKRY